MSDGRRHHRPSISLAVTLKLILKIVIHIIASFAGCCDGAVIAAARPAVIICLASLRVQLLIRLTRTLLLSGS